MSLWRPTPTLTRQQWTRSSVSQEDRSDELVLRVFDAWAEQGDNPGAVQAGRWEFDSGVPGSGQVIRTHRFGRAVATVSDEYGVCGLYGSPKEMLRDWLDSEASPRDITGAAVPNRALDSLVGEQRPED